MTEFDHLELCCAKWSKLSTTKRTRKQQAVIDVMDLIGAVEGDGFVGWWEGLLRFGDVERDVPRSIESFRMAGLEDWADAISQTSFCREVIAAGIASEADEFEFSKGQEQILGSLHERISARTPDAREALLQFLPRIPA